MAGSLSSAAPVAAEPESAVHGVPKLAVESYQLDNGMTVLLSRDTRLPVVTVEMRYLVGSGHERKGRSGFAHLFEHLMFQGSASYDDEYFKPFEPIGGVVNGSTNTDRTNYFERVPSNYLELALWMESDRMQRLLPALTREKLDNQRDVVKNERRQRYENPPYGMVWKYLQNELYPVGHPYHHTTIGSHADLTAATLDDVKEFFRTYYVPANAVVTVVGDFEVKPTKALIEKYFGGITAGKRAPTPTAKPVTLSGVQKLTRTDAIELPRVYLAWPTPALFAAGDAEMDVLAAVLTRGKTSRLYKPLVYDAKVAKDVGAFQVSRNLGSMFVVYATAAPGTKVETLEKKLFEALETAMATPPSADEVTRAVTAWRKSFFQRVESVISRATLLSTYYHLAGKADYLSEDLARYTRLDPAKVHAAARAHISTKDVLQLNIVKGAKAGGESVDGPASEGR